MCFQVDSHPDYVTVNTQFPNFDPTNYKRFVDTALQFAASDDCLWVSLVEKAYAQLMEQPNAAGYEGSANAYAAINGGDNNGLEEITGQTVDEMSILYSTSFATVKSDLSMLQQAYAVGQEATLATSANEFGNWIGGHMYAILNVNAVAGTVTVYNPWGNGIAADNMVGTFTASISDLQQEGVTIEYTVGKTLNI